MPPERFLFEISKEPPFLHEREATETAAKVLSIDPKFSLDRYEKNLPDKKQDDKERFIGALRKPGLK